MRRFQINRSVIVGLGFWVGMLVVGYFTIIVQKSREVKQPTFMPVRLVTAEGLKIGAPVRMLGVDYGVLSSLHYMEIDATGWPIPWSEDGTADRPRPAGQTVIAIIDLVDRPRLYSNYTIFTRTERPLEPKGVDINPGQMDSAAVREIEPLLLDRAGRQHFATTGILPRKREILVAKNFDDPFFQIAVILTENRQGIRRITFNSAQFTSKIDAGQGTLALLLNRDDIYAGANGVLKEAIFLAGDARDLLETARENRQPVEFLEIFIALAFAAL